MSISKNMNRQDRSYKFYSIFEGKITSLYLLLEDRIYWYFVTALSYEDRRKRHENKVEILSQMIFAPYY